MDPNLGIQSLHWAAFLFPKLLIKLASPSSELVGKKLPACHLYILPRDADVGFMGWLCFTLSRGGANSSPHAGLCNVQPSQRA